MQQDGSNYSFAVEENELCGAPYPPEEAMFNIFIFLPAEVLYDVMRYVCKQWYAIISSPVFIRSHLLSSKACLLINRLGCWCFDACSVEFTGKQDTVIKELKYQFARNFLVSCDGLITFHDAEHVNLFIANPVTKESLALPSLHPNYRFTRYRGALVRTPVSNKYKVVYYLYHKTPPVHASVIVTVGVDSSWRFIDCKHLTPRGKAAFHSFPTSAGGFFYWVSYFSLLVMDVETEIIQEFSLPSPLRNLGYKFFCLMGNYLSMFLKISKLKWDIWKLTDLRNGGLTKLYTIDLEGEIHRLRRNFGFEIGHYISPEAWCKNGEFLIFRIRDKGIHTMPRVENIIVSSASNTMVEPFTLNMSAA